MAFAIQGHTGRWMGPTRCVASKLFVSLLYGALRRNVQTVDSAEAVMSFRRETWYVSSQLATRSYMKRHHLAQPVVAGVMKDLLALQRTFGVHNLVH